LGKKSEIKKLGECMKLDSKKKNNTGRLPSGFKHSIKGRGGKRCSRSRGTLGWKGPGSTAGGREKAQKKKEIKRAPRCPSSFGSEVNEKEPTFPRTNESKSSKETPTQEKTLLDIIKDTG